LREVKVIRDGFESDDQARPVTLNITEGKSLKDLGIKIEDDLPKYIKEDIVYHHP
jgi:chromosome segregation and condensation protein ScpB